MFVYVCVREREPVTQKLTLNNDNKALCCYNKAL